MGIGMWVMVILFAISIVVAIGSFLFGFGEKSLWMVTAGAAFVALFFWICMTITPVGTRQFAIVTAWGRPTGEALDNGLHWTMPWEQTTEMNGAVQIDKYTKEPDKDSRITVRLGNSTLAQADVSIRWEIKQSDAPELFQQYQEFSHVQTNLIERNLQVAMNKEFAGLNPLDPKNLDVSPLPGIEKAVLADMQHDVGNQVNVLDVQLPTIQYDPDTEQKISQINQQRAATTVAVEQLATNKAQAAANDAITASISGNPAVVANNCINKALDKGISPLGCWPGTGAVASIPLDKK